MNDASVMKWLAGIFLMVLVVALWLSNQDTSCVGDGGGQYSYETCE